MASFTRRKFFGLFCLLLLAATVSLRAAGSVAVVDADNGLPDAHLGASLGTFVGLRKTEDTGRWLSYDRPADKLEFIGVPLKTITYNFFKDKLYSIDLELEGKRSVHGMLKALESRYGTSHTFETKTYAQTTAQMEVREWAGLKAYCVYKSAADATGAELVLLDRPTWDLMQVPREQRQAMSREMLKGSYTNGDF